MTDKQIIIEDLETPCPYHCSDKIGQCNNSSQETPHTYCTDNKDCIYKQYARKEQECEKAKQNAQDTYDLWQALIESFNILQGEKIKLEQECEELKEQLTILDDEDVVVEITVKQFEEYKKLKQTLAVIKEVIEGSCCFQIISNCEEFKNCAECGRNSDAETLRLVLEKLNEVLNE